MSYTKTQIANRALDLLGQSSVLTDLDTDTSTAGKALRRHYDEARKAVLQAYPWNFATKRASLSALPERPAWPAGGYYYSFPADCLAMRGIEDERRDEPWSTEVIGSTQNTLERVMMVERAGPIKVLYTADIERLDVWSEMARDALQALLASKVAMPITNKQSAVQLSYSVYEASLQGARRADAQEGSTHEPYQGSWVTARW